MVYIGANGFGIGLLIRSYFNRSALLTPVGPDFRALMIGLGVLLGVLVTVAKREAWLLGFGGDFIARKLWEWRAVHGLSSCWKLG